MLTVLCSSDAFLSELSAFTDMWMGLRKRVCVRTHACTRRGRVGVLEQRARSGAQELRFGVPVPADGRRAQDKSLSSSGSNLPRETTGPHEII